LEGDTTEKGQENCFFQIWLQDKAISVLGSGHVVNLKEGRRIEQTKKKKFIDWRGGRLKLQGRGKTAKSAEERSLKHKTVTRRKLVGKEGGEWQGGGTV